jgi:pyruvate dehydrogenase E1 component
MAQVPRDSVLLTVCDGHLATLSWLGGVVGHRAVSQGIEHFGQTRAIGDLYRHDALDRKSLAGSVLNHSLGAGSAVAAGLVSDF